MCAPLPPRNTFLLPFKPASSHNPSETSCRRVDGVSPRYPARALYNRHHFGRQRGCSCRASLCRSLASPSHPTHLTTAAPRRAREGKVGFGGLVKSKTNSAKASSKGARHLLRSIATMKGRGAIV